MKGRPNFPLLHHLFADSVEDFVRFLKGCVTDYRPWLVVGRLSLKYRSMAALIALRDETLNSVPCSRLTVA